MADSQSTPTIFSLRIVSIDYYTAPPIPAVDVCYSSFQGGKVKEVPVIRIYGSTPAGQKTCLHIHKAFPYLYVPCSDIRIHPNQRDDAAYTDNIALAIEKALKLKGSAASKRQHVHGCSLVRAKRFYGFHLSEEFFVKIYLYHPHDVSRAANLLLGGAVLGKSLQPHESHIPFILQFLVDYNLYGMGHVHLSKMKFRSPVPDIFTQRKYNYSGNSRLETDEKTSFPADIKADLAGGECLNTPVWISSTIQGDWMWQCSNEFDALSDQEFNLVKRQSICELEGDATVNDIINQQFKTYTSLSQTHSDVKMVQSLIAIWEEEYERTGVHETTVLPDPGKPLPDDVLKTLSHGLGFEKELTELCVEPEENLSLIETAERFQQSSRFFAIEEDLVGHENFNSDNANEESLKCSAETDCIMSLSQQGSLSEAEGVAHRERGNAYPTSIPASDVQSSEMIGTFNSKAPDKEALGLLRWLATSQAAEDINSDDELVCEPILSPLLPAITIDKVLEKANSDYESESQKECQDILNSIDDIVNSDGLQDKESRSLDCSHYPQTSEVEKTLVNASSQPGLAENSSDIQIQHECERYSGHHVSQTGRSFISKRKRKNSSWCSLPFSLTKNMNNDLESDSSKMADMIFSDNKECADTPVAGGKGKCSDAFVNNKHTEASESIALMSCSVRDLMRRKRCHKAGGVKNVQLEEPEEYNIILPKQLNFYTHNDDEHGEKLLAVRSPGFRPSAATEQTEIMVGHVFEPPLASENDDPWQVAIEPTSADAQTNKLQHDSLRKDSAFSIAHCETKSGKEYGSSTTAEAITSDVFNPIVGPFSGNRLEAMEIVSPSSSVHAAERHEKKDRHEDMTSNHTPNNNFIGTAISTDATDLQETSSISKYEIGCSVAITTSMQDKPVDLSNTTSCKKLPTADLKDGASEDISFSNAPSYHTSHFKEKIDGASGSPSDDFSFCKVEGQVKKKFQNKSIPDGDYNVQQEPLSGVPTYYQNDGSRLYILTPALSPPSADSVRRWLAHGQGDAHGEPYAASAEPPSRKGVEGVLTGSDLVDHVLDQVPQETNRNVNGESQPCHDEVQKVLQTEGNIKKLNAYTIPTINESQLSGPDGRSRSTPLSQIGFRDPASIGAGQQLTLLSLEIQAESRGDLRPDPRMDAIQVVSLAFQNDDDSAIDVLVLLLSKSESCQRSIDGVFGYKVFSFSDEKHLFSHLMRLIGSLDPDILMGWDVQGGSLGFLAERAAHLGIRLLNEISRTPLAPNLDHSDAEISEKGIMDVMLHELSITDSTTVEDALIEDEWGRTHGSGLHVGGRIVLNVWRLMRGEVKLNMYTVEAVSDTVLRRKVPSIPYKVLTRWFSSGSGRARYRCIEYVTVRAKLNLEIMNHLDMINRTSELARIFGIDFFSVLSRGSQYRVESMFLRLAHTQNYLAISPGNQQVASQPAMECLPLVMEPESGFYVDPVIVLDFQSLYPSMIIAYNLCFCTCLGSVAPSKANILGVSSFSPDPHLFHDLKANLLLTPNDVMYVPSKVRKGVLPRLLEEILATRIMVKQAMKKLNPSQQVLHRIFNARQLALKLIANVTYGYTAAGFSGRMPCAELADSIVQCGRSTLEKAISLVNANDKWRAKVIYGDTDSMFVLLKGRTVEESFQIGREIASAVTAINPDPITLKFEKVYQPCFLLTKKRYVGYSYESVDQTVPTFDAKGIETVRRDTCGAVAKMMEQSLRLFFEHQDIYEIKAYLQRQWTRILSGRVSLQDFVFAKEVRLGTYRERTPSSLPPAAIVAAKAMKTDPRAEPRYGERVPYVVIHGEPGARLIDMVVDPLDLLAIDSPFRLNDTYYITKQIIPALQRVFGLVGADLNQWFSEMPRQVREALAKRPPYGSNPQRTRIDYYYLSKHCVLCGELVQSSSHVCNKCLQKEAAVATAVTGRTSKLEREMQHLVAICRHCGGGDWLIESGVKCTSLACPVFYERRKVQKELQGLAAVAAEKGFYPKCMVEWF